MSRQNWGQHQNIGLLRIFCYWGFSALSYAIFAFVFYCGNGTCPHFITKSPKIYANIHTAIRRIPPIISPSNLHLYHNIIWLPTVTITYNNLYKHNVDTSGKSMQSATSVLLSLFCSAGVSRSAITADIRLRGYLGSTPKIPHNRRSVVRVICWRRGESNPCPEHRWRKHLHVQMQIAALTGGPLCIGLPPSQEPVDVMPVRGSPARHLPTELRFATLVGVRRWIGRVCYAAIAYSFLE